VSSAEVFTKPRSAFPHLLVTGTAQAEPYTYPLEVRGGPKFALPPRNRREHADRLLASLDRVRQSVSGLHRRREVAGIAGDHGLYLELESDPGFELMLKSLDRTRDGLELVAVRLRSATMLATVFVGEGKLGKLERLITSYRDEDNQRFGQPKNKKLVESMAEIRLAVLESFWTDAVELFPDPGSAVWWEVWLRVGANRQGIDTAFTEQAKAAGIRVEPWRIRFADRTVVLAFSTPEQMRKSVELLDCLAELRLAKERPDFFMGLEGREQADWIRDFLARLERSGEPLPALCLLDTGVNNGHPLVRDGLADADVLTCNPEWGSEDHEGHGTAMAGLGLFGDLVAPLSGSEPHSLEHCLESVKILPPPGFPSNDRELYGALTQEAMARAEVNAPGRDRVFCMAVTTREGRDEGRPSSWSAAVDAACGGFEDDQPRLVVLAAGNVERSNWRHYPDRNDIDPIHDPGQAWNALTVGALTEKVLFDTSYFPEWTPVATPGGLSPSATTSMAWRSPWPNKPDLVLEGGNAIREPGTDVVDTDDALLLLTTHWRPADRLFTTMGDTSAASALAARMAAILLARYPEFWPETLRGLLVHSANWTPEMVRAAPGPAASRTRLRRYGYGVPDLARASSNATNILTLIVQEQLQPFEQRGSRVVTKDMHLHALPWPRAELRSLGEQRVELRVTLSYFVEPNPARRGWKYRHRYASHALRFAIKAATEDLDDFRARLSKDAQDEEHGVTTLEDPGWEIGPRNRNQGSLHSDRWFGTAADLAERGYLAVYPVGGWWKERPASRRFERSVRYSLIVTIRTPELEIDIYTPIASQVVAEVAV
jgi:hypothetical protein